MTRFNVKLNIKRGIALLLALVCLSSVPVLTASAEGGTCGEKLSWSYSYGTLTIQGEGEMATFNEFDTAPWYHLRGDIKRVILPEGLTSIGRLAFYGCTALQAIAIPDNVRTIGDSAFYECTALELVDFPSKLSHIKRQAFYGCSSLAAIPLPISVESIGDKAFYLCESLVSVTIPRYAENLGTQIFAYCTSLLRVQIDAYITSIPEWMFYGCENLAEVALPSTVTAVDFYAFKRCDGLTGIYHSGSAETLNSIRGDIAESNPNFGSSGYIGSGTLTNTSFSSETEYTPEGNLISQTNTTVTVETGMTLVTEVVSKPGSESTGGTYTTDFTLIIEDEASWDAAADAVSDALSDINDSYSINNTSGGATLTIYTNDTSSVDEAFLKEMAGRDMVIEIVAPSGNTWRVDCGEIRSDDVTGSPNYSYTIDSATEESCDALGTDNVFNVNFSQSSSLKTELLVQLPSNSVGTNAFLYQVEEDGTHTRLQATAVDNNGNAHFYLATVDKDTQYVVGLNVPGESTDDVIIPNELSANYGAIQRLEKIEYVTTGVRAIEGFTLTHVILIVIGILVFTAIIIGTFMYFMNKKKLMKNAHTAK